MDLKRRLAQLGPGPPQSPLPPAPNTHALDTCGASTSDRDQMIAELREHIAQLMQRTPVASAPRVPPGPPLDFVPYETGAGVVHRRTRHFSPEHWIGCFPVKAALEAQAQYWALLALDPGLARLQPTRALFLDTETTGLGGGAGIVAFLIGLAWFDGDGQLVLEQLLIRSPAEEPAQLEVLSERVAECSTLITFNGKSFDWPLLAGRYTMNHLICPELPCHFDLLHVARRLHKPRLPRVNLKALELGVIALDRGPDIDGAEIGPRYQHFLRTHDEDAIRPVIEHNAIDVLSMVALAGLYGEPLERVATGDLVSLGKVLRRARDLDQAHQVAERAVQIGLGDSARRLRAELARARGDRDAALADFEDLCESIDDPEIRLELAKLYEHHAKAPMRALQVVERGTGEPPHSLERRRQRLERKVTSLRHRQS